MRQKTNWRFFLRVLAARLASRLRFRECRPAASVSAGRAGGDETDAAIALVASAMAIAVRGDRFDAVRLVRRASVQGMATELRR